MDSEKNNIVERNGICTNSGSTGSTLLASILGSRHSSVAQPTCVIPSKITWLKKSKRKNDESSDFATDLEKTVTELLNPTKVKTAAKFDRTYKAFLDRFSKKMSGEVLLSSTAILILKIVIQRCNDNKTFWPQKTLLRVITEGHIPASSCPTFVTLAIKLNDVIIINCCVEYMQDIPDVILAICLQFYIRHFRKAADENQMDSSDLCPLTSECAQCVNKVLCQPFNDTFIIDNLQQISFDDALVLLRYLQFLLTNTMTSSRDESTPTANVVVDWISVLLDAHFTQLLLSPEARTLLTELAQSVQMQEGFYSELEAVHTLLQSFTSSACIAAKQTSGTYSIDVVMI